MNSLPEVGAWVRGAVESDAFREWILELLVELCTVDTTPGPDIEDLAYTLDMI